MYGKILIMGDRMRIIMHIDVNNAFLSWEAIYLLNKGYKYDIRNSYAVIGGDEASRRGIVLAKSTSAKKLGIITGEPLYSARKKCKVLRVYPAHYSFYYEMSEKLFQLLKKYTPDIEKASVDECYLDYTKIMYIYGDYMEFAKKIQLEIKETLGFTVNIGIANNKLCAKMASDFSKPFKIHTLFDNEIESKMYPLPIEDLFGIGKKTAPKLRELNINTIGDLANMEESFLRKYFKNQALPMILQAQGKDDREVDGKEHIPKGISHSTTLSHDYRNLSSLYPILEELTEQVCIELRKQNKYAYVVATFIKNSSFKVMSHQRRLKNATSNTLEIYKVAKSLLEEMWNEESIRLIGIRVDNFTDSMTEQLSLFQQATTKQENHELDKVMDNLKQKYGTKVINRASHLKK